jgi:hypothetical protein
VKVGRIPDNPSAFSSQGFGFRKEDGSASDKVAPLYRIHLPKKLNNAIGICMNNCHTLRRKPLEG